MFNIARTPIFLVLLTAGVASEPAQSAHPHDAQFFAHQMVLRVQGNDVCYIVDEQHLRALGGAGRVQSLPAYEQILRPGQAIKPCTVIEGFFRYRRSSAVYYLSEEGGCQVRNPEQLRLLGGHGQVTEVNRAELLPIDRRNVQYCAWPDGFYKQQYSPEVLRVRGRQVCRVAGLVQLRQLGGRGRVRDIGDFGELMTGRTDAGLCAWPDGFYSLARAPAVYAVRNGRVCHVRSPDQLRAMGGAGRVQRLPEDAQLTAGPDPVPACR